jgi:hypothetical protein
VVGEMNLGDSSILAIGIQKKFLKVVDIARRPLYYERVRQTKANQGGSVDDYSYERNA